MKTIPLYKVYNAWIVLKNQENGIIFNKIFILKKNNKKK